MSSLNSIPPAKLLRLVGTAACPAIVDCRRTGGPAVPLSRPLDPDLVDCWAGGLAGRSAVVVCDDGKRLSPGVAAWLRHREVDAEILEGGFEAWEAAGYPLIDAGKLPERNPSGSTIWVTRSRPKVDRIACPWLIRRFVDPDAIFLFVAASDVESVAAQFEAAPFDCEGVFWSHRGEQCSFDTMVEELGLGGFEALERLRVIVRGADTGRPDLAPQCSGLVASSLGLSRIYSDDLEQLDAGMLLYDALYRWCRDATEETHDWVSHSPRSRVRA